MLIGNLAIHVMKNSPKHPEAKFSIYFQPLKLKFGISRRTKNGAPRVLLLQRRSSRWVGINVKGAGLKNDESVD